MKQVTPTTTIEIAAAMAKVAADTLLVHFDIIPGSLLWAVMKLPVNEKEVVEIILLNDEIDDVNVIQIIKSFPEISTEWKGNVGGNL